MNQQELKDKIKERVFSAISAITQERKKQNRFSAPEMSEEEKERIIFNGNSYDGVQKRFSLNEAIDTIPQISAAEIKEFESAMENLVANIPNASLVFDIQTNGYYMDIKMTPQGAEALASGNIHISSNSSLKWIFSLQDGFKFMAEEPLTVDQDNKNLITQIQDYYAAWQKDWKEKLSQSKELNTAVPAPEVGNQQTPGGSQMDQSNAGAEFGAAQV